MKTSHFFKARKISFCHSTEGSRSSWARKTPYLRRGGNLSHGWRCWERCEVTQKDLQHGLTALNDVALFVRDAIQLENQVVEHGISVGRFAFEALQLGRRELPECFTPLIFNIRSTNVSMLL